MIEKKLRKYLIIAVIAILLGVLMVGICDSITFLKPFSYAILVSGIIAAFVLFILYLQYLIWKLDNVKRKR